MLEERKAEEKREREASQIRRCFELRLAGVTLASAYRAAMRLSSYMNLCATSDGIF
jgi:hypothetical protein